MNTDENKIKIMEYSSVQVHKIRNKEYVMKFLLVSNWMLGIQCHLIQHIFIFYVLNILTVNTTEWRIVENCFVFIFLIFCAFELNLCKICLQVYEI